MGTRKTALRLPDLAAIAADLAFIKKSLLQSKTVFTPECAADYMGISLSTLYKMTSAGTIPFSKPNGKLIFFAKADIDRFLLSNKTKTVDEKEIGASTYVTTHKNSRS